jgi:hypothetical protein
MVNWPPGIHTIPGRLAVADIVLLSGSVLMPDPCSCLGEEFLGLWR